MKRAAREKYREIREDMGKNIVEEKSSLIIEKLLSLPEVSNASTIMFYYPVNNEVDLIPLMKEFLGKKELLLPRLIENDLSAFVFESFDKMVNGKFNIPEPDSERFDDEVDVVIVPGVVFDKEKFRIGMGQGYYDKFLSGKKCLKIGVCYDFQLTDKVWRDPHDIAMDIIVSEKGIMK